MKRTIRYRTLKSNIAYYNSNNPIKIPRFTRNLTKRPSKLKYKRSKARIERIVH